MKTSLYKYKKTGSTPYLVYCWFLPRKLEDEEYFMVAKRNEMEQPINAGRPWLCVDDANGVTGLMGMIIMADNENSAKKIIRKIRKQFRDADQEPDVWR